MSLQTALARKDARPYFWVEIDGLAERYGMLEDGTDAVYDDFNPPKTTLGQILVDNKNLGSANWLKNNLTNGVVTLAPNGEPNADELVEGAAGFNFIYQQQTTGVGGTWVFSAYVKPSNRTWCRLAVGLGSPTYCYFDMANFAVGSSVNCTGYIRQIDANWSFVSIAFAPTATTINAVLNIAEADGDVSLTYSGPVSSMFAWNLRLAPRPAEHINRLLAATPSFGGQSVDLLKSTSSGARLGFELLDYGDEITALLEYPDENTRLTSNVTKSATEIQVESISDLADETAQVYIDAETISHDGAIEVTNTPTVVANKASQTTAAGAQRNGQGINIGDSSAFLDQGANFWVGATVTINDGTSPANGESRVVYASYKDSFGNNRLEMSTPFSSGISSGVNYLITAPARGMFITPPAGLPDDYYVGGSLVVSSGTNTGDRTFVRSYDSTDGFMTFLPALSAPPDATTVPLITIATLLNCQRGQYRSVAEKHRIDNASGGLARRYVHTNVPYLKKRGMVIKMNCEGEAETEALAWRGTVKDVKISRLLSCYKFDCDGLLSELSRNVMHEPAVTELQFNPIWGGFIRTQIKRKKVDGVRLLDINWSYVTSDNSSTCYVGQFQCRGDAEFPAVGNVKVDDEIIHHNGSRISYSSDGTVGVQFFLGEPDRFTGTGANYTGNDPQERATVEACLDNRAILSELIGAAKIQKEPIFQTKADQKAFNLYQPEPASPEVSALMAEHTPGTEVKQCFVSLNSALSDVPRYDSFLMVAAAGTIEPGQSVVGSTSNVSATLMSYDPTDRSGLIAFADPPEGRLLPGETLVFGGGSGSGTVGFYTQEVRRRNNVVDVILQLMCSTGERASNGVYDSLPAGFGIEIPQEWIDFDSFEALRDSKLAHFEFNGYVEEPTAIKEILEDSISPLYQVSVVQLNNGKLGLIEAATTEKAVVFDTKGLVTLIDDDEISAVRDPNWSIGQEPIAKVSIEYNRDGGGEHLTKTEIYFDEANDGRKQAGQNVEVKASYLYSTKIRKNYVHTNPEMPPALRRMSQITLDRFARNPAPVIVVDVDFEHIQLNVGDIVSVDETRLPNVRNGTRGFSASYHQVLGIKPNYTRSTVALTLMQIGTSAKRYGRFAPSGKITAWNSGTRQITIEAHEFSPPGGSELDSDSFAVGEKVQVFDAALGNTGEVLEIQSVASNVLTLTTVPTTDTPTVGGYITYASYDDCTSAQKNSRAFMADTEETIGAASDVSYRYE